MLQDLDTEFISRAMKVTSFNITTKDLQDTKHKREIQYLFGTHLFPSFDLSKTVNGLNKDKINSLISQLRTSGNFQSLHSYNLKGVGPGEATLYFLINNSYLGGGSSAGADLFVGSDTYELKAVKVSRDNLASDFKLGGTVPLSPIIVALNNLREELKLSGTRTEMSSGIMAEMKQKNPVRYSQIESDYADIAYNSYFKNHEIVFINNAPGQKLGNIEAIKEVKKSDIMIERVTSGTVKPKVKL